MYSGCRETCGSEEEVENVSDMTTSRLVGLIYMIDRVNPCGKLSGDTLPKVFVGVD